MIWIIFAPMIFVALMFVFMALVTCLAMAFAKLDPITAPIGAFLHRHAAAFALAARLLAMVAAFYGFYQLITL